MADELFDRRQPDRVGFAAQANSVTCRSRARSAAYSVYVVFGIVRQVVVDDVLHVRDVQTA